MKARTVSGEPQRTRDAHVVIVGLGLSGGAAAIEAADFGARVIVLEKMPQGGGCAQASTAQLSGACTKLQLKAGINDSPLQHYAECMAIGEYENDSILLRIACENAGPTIDWLQEIGVPLYLSTQTGHEAYATRRTCAVVPEKAIGNGGMNLFNAVYAEVEKRTARGDITVHCSTRVTGLLKDDSGRVTGVTLTDKEGRRDCYARAVVLATGGFAGNPDMMAKFNPHLKGVLVFPLLAAFASGDGIVMAEAAGARITRKGFATGYPGGVEDPEQPGMCAFIAAMKQYPGAIWVNKEGRRFVNENTSRDTVRENAAIAVPDCIVYIILDRRIREENRPIIEGNFVGQGLDWRQFEEEASRGRFIWRADTVEGLAAKTGLDPTILATTVASYNVSAAARKDQEFGRQELNHRIENPPFYAVKTRPRVLSGMPGDGIAVNADMRVIDTRGKVIPGLFACGDAIGTAAVSGRHPCAGFALTPAMVFGRIAGRNAAIAAMLPTH